MGAYREIPVSSYLLGSVFSISELTSHNDQNVPFCRPEQNRTFRSPAIVHTDTTPNVVDRVLETSLLWFDERRCNSLFSSLKQAPPVRVNSSSTALDFLTSLYLRLWPRQSHDAVFIS